MSYSPLACGFLLVSQTGTPVIEESQQGRYALIFLRREDVICYRQQISAVRNVRAQAFQIAAMPIHQLKSLLNLQKVNICMVDNWQVMVA